MSNPAEARAAPASDAEGRPNPVSMTPPPKAAPIASMRLNAPIFIAEGRLGASPAYLEQVGTQRQPSDLAEHNVLSFSFRRSEPGWSFREGGQDFILPVSGNVAANNGTTLVLLALRGLGITRVGNFHIGEELAADRLVPLL